MHWCCWCCCCTDAADQMMLLLLIKCKLVLKPILRDSLIIWVSHSCTMSSSVTSGILNGVFGIWLGWYSLNLVWHILHSNSWQQLKNFYTSTGCGNHDKYQFWMIESADNFEQWVDATFMFYPFPENVCIQKREWHIDETAWCCTDQKDTNKDWTEILAMNRQK